MTDLRSSNVGRDDRDRLLRRLAQTASAFRLTPRRWLLFGAREFSGRAAARAVSYATDIGRADGRNPGFDRYTERPRLPKRLLVHKLTKPTQEQLGQDAHSVLARELRRVKKAGADAATGTVKRRWILLVILLVGIFEYVVGVHVANVVYHLREEESRLIAVALAVISSLGAWAIGAAIREQLLPAVNRWVSLILGALIVVFIASLGITLATKGGSDLLHGLVTGGEYGQTTSSGGGSVSSMLSSARHLLYPVALGMGAGLILLIEIIGRQHDARRQRDMNAKSYRLTLRLVSTMTDAAARIMAPVQLSKTVERAGVQLLRGYDAGVDETLPPELKDILETEPPPQTPVAPTWREEMETAAGKLRDEAARLGETEFPSAATA